MARAEGGDTVVCLGGHPSPLLTHAVAGQFEPARLGRARTLAPEHPLFANLQPRDLAKWGLDGIVADAVLPMPRGANYVVLADAPGRGEPRPVLVELWCGRNGRGRILLCGMSLLEKLDADPVAATLMANLLRWGQLEGRVPALPAAWLGTDEESNALEAVRKLGVRFVVGGPAEDGVMVTDDVAAALRRCPRLFLGRGTLLIFGVDRTDVDALNEALIGRWERSLRAPVPRLGLAVQEPGVAAERDTHALTAGVRPEDMRQLVRSAHQSGAHPLTAEADAQHFTALDGRGYIAKYERDDLRVICWQPLPPSETGPEARVLAALLTNLRVRMDTTEEGEGR
jgi:hypothetical protein